MISRINRGDKLEFTLNSDGVLYRFADGIEQLVIPTSPQQRVLQLSH